MTPRLLSLLSLIENALGRDVAKQPSGALSVRRTANFQRGTARLMINDDAGFIVLHHFHLAAGAMCVRVTLGWQGQEEGGQVVLYPTGAHFNWSEAADHVAAAWLAGLSAVGAQAKGPGLEASL